MFLGPFTYQALRAYLSIHNASLIIALFISMFAKLESAFNVCMCAIGLGCWCPNVINTYVWICRSMLSFKNVLHSMIAHLRFLYKETTNERTHHENMRIHGNAVSFTEFRVPFPDGNSCIAVV